MKRSTLLAALLAVVLAACGGTGGVVATVNGMDITLGEVEALRASQSGAVPREQFNEDLRNVIVEVLVIRAAEESYGISFTPEQVEARRAEIQGQIEGQGVDYEEFLETQGFTDERIRRIAHQQLVSQAVQDRLSEEAGPVSEEDVEAEYDRRLFGLTEACVQHVLVETEEEAEEVVSRIEGGESIADVAADVSIDPSAEQNAGDLGCGPLDQYVAEFAQAAFDAEVGDVVGPVRSQFGYHVIQVESRETQPFDEVRDEVTQQVEDTRGLELFQEWLLEVVTEAEVEVDAEYGRWVTNPVPQILPPQ